MNSFSVVGIGPGHRDYILPISLKEIEEAQLLVGGKRHLEHFAYLEKNQLKLKGNYSEVFDFIRENYRDMKIAVLVSGDPGYHSLLRLITKSFKSNEYDVFPGLSSFQLAMTKIGKPWNDAKLISLHGKKLEEIVLKNNKIMVLLTDHKNTPYAIAQFLLGKGYKCQTAYIAENLSYENERISKMKLEDIKEEEYKLCVMIIE